MKVFKTILLIGSIFLAIAYWSGTRPKTAIDWSNVNDDPRPAPLLILKDRSGSEIKLDSLKGKPILLNFWASWCPPCIEELPSLLEFSSWAKTNIEDLQILAISVDEKWKNIDELFLMKKLWTAGPLPFLIYLSSANLVSNDFGTNQFPETFFIDRDFKIRRKFVGPQNWTSQEVVSWLSKNSK